MKYISLAGYVGSIVTATTAHRHICGTRMKEGSRRSLGERWCFRHRRREEFFHVVMVPDGLSYYGPHIEIKGPHYECTDLFPGWSREWAED